MPIPPTAIAAALHGVIDPINAILYLCPEAREEWEELGLEPLSQGYAAGRTAPMGAIGAGLATATFYGYSPAMLEEALADAWQKATPQQVLDARARAVQRILERCAAPLNDVAEATWLAREATELAEFAGRPLAAANARVAAPVQPFAALWQATCVLREHRGDGHIALLVSHEVPPVQSLVLYAAWQSMVGRRFLQVTRRWDDEAWEAAQDALRDRGWLDAEGALTAAGQAFRDELETDTDRLAAQPYAALGEEKSLRLFDLLVPIVEAMNSGRAFKRQVPIPDRPTVA